jgi:hypothetical protein
MELCWPRADQSTPKHPREPSYLPSPFHLVHKFEGQPSSSPDWRIARLPYRKTSVSWSSCTCFTPSERPPLHRFEGQQAECNHPTVLHLYQSERVDPGIGFVSSLALTVPIAPTQRSLFVPSQR